MEWQESYRSYRNSYVLLKSLNLNNTINNAKSYILTQTNLGSLGPGYFTGTGGLCNVSNQIPKMNYPYLRRWIIFPYHNDWIAGGIYSIL